MEFGKIISSFKSKKGNTVVFRYPKEDDFSSIWQFAKALAREDTFIELNQEPTEEEERKWFDDMITKVTKGESIYLCALVNGVFAGNVHVEKGRYRRRHVGHMGISLLAPYRDEGIGSVLMQTAIDEAKTRGLRLLTLTCFENNPRALHVYEKLGFQNVGVIPGDLAYKGDYIGSIHMYLPLA